MAGYATSLTELTQQRERLQFRQDFRALAFMTGYATSRARLMQPRERLPLIFHDFNVVAPLKLCDPRCAADDRVDLPRLQRRGPIEAASPSPHRKALIFHDFNVVAPLKLPSGMKQRSGSRIFHDFDVVAPLKLHQ